MRLDRFVVLSSNWQYDRIPADGLTRSNLVALTILFILLPTMSSYARFPTPVDTVGSLGLEDKGSNQWTTSDT